MRHVLKTVSDTVLKDSIEVVRKLQSINVESILLTGDNLHAASHIAKSVGITNFQPKCLPEHKMTTIEEYQNKNEMVCIVGDGLVGYLTNINLRHHFGSL
ncbi:HAD family hydrolase [Clostridium sp.]|uniref:HAD family hydrolase n=1 Tax=Clostridium sp. TaxID=1506 RepID=UPI002FC6C2ED